MLTSCAEYKYKNFVDCAKQIWSREGPIGFYSGAPMIFLQSATGATIYFIFDMIIKDMKRKDWMKEIYLILMEFIVWFIKTESINEDLRAKTYSYGGDRLKIRNMQRNYIGSYVIQVSYLWYPSKEQIMLFEIILI